MKKKKLIIHIGMHKTGSSSIQSSLHKYLKVGSSKNIHLCSILCKYLKVESFNYIHLFSLNHSGSILTLFKKNSKSVRSIFLRAIDIKAVEQRKKMIQEKLIQEITESNADNFILSGEGITQLSESELKEMKAFFNNLSLEIMVVAYIRPPIGFIQSSFQQRLKGDLKKFNLSNAVPRYKYRFEKFDKIFYKENVHLWKFDQKEFLNGDVVQDFCLRLGIPIIKEQIQRENETLSKEAISLLYIYRKYGAEYGVGNTVIQENISVIEGLANIGSHKFKLSPDLVNPILEKNKEDIDWMEERLGMSLSESFGHHENDIKSEEDLEKLAIRSLKLIEGKINKKYLEKNIDITTLQGVAKTVHALRLEARDKIKTYKGNR